MMLVMANTIDRVYVEGNFIPTIVARLILSYLIYAFQF